jgi:ABC-type sugar transport system substrate-binding protein
VPSKSRAQTRSQGKGAVETAVKLIKGEKVESFVWIPFELVTQDNYKDYLKK